LSVKEAVFIKQCADIRPPRPNKECSMKKYKYESIASVLPAALGSLGVDWTTSTGINTAEAKATFALGRHSKVLVILVDGLGYNNLTSILGHIPFLRSKLDSAKVLTTSFPSTTSAALSTFATGTCPGKTGILGYTQLNSKTGKLANMLSWSNAEKPETLQKEKTMFELAVENGLTVGSTGYKRFKNSKMSKAIFKGQKFRGRDNPKKRMDVALELLKENDLTYLYWGEIDKTGHANGWKSSEWSLAVEFFDGELEKLVASLPQETLVLITADHGMIDGDRDNRVNVPEVKELSKGIKVTGGEPRAMHLYSEQGEAENVKKRWSNFFEDNADIWTKKEAVASGLFGDVSESVLDNIGDVVVAMQGDSLVIDTRFQSAHSLKMVGYHGSTTKNEIQIPLFSVVI
jgi:predicted AlkP superfamily pyrophosphatase or phosphodiesterase